MLVRCLGLALMAALSISIQAHAYTYSQGTANVSRAIPLKGETGESINLASGPVSIEIDSYGVFWGDGSLAVKSAQGTAKIKIPRANFESAWKFFAPANAIGQQVAIKGSASDRVVGADIRQEVVNCGIEPYELPVHYPNGNPVTYEVQNADNTRSRQHLSVRLCAQVVDGRTSGRQVGPWESCDGTQRVEKQRQTTTEVFTVEFINPSDSKVIGKIEATARVSTTDKIVRVLSACE